MSFTDLKHIFYLLAAVLLAFSLGQLIGGNPGWALLAAALSVLLGGVFMLARSGEDR